MWTAEEPEILGSLAKVDVQKDSISCGNYQRDSHMPSPFGTEVCGARRVERRPAGREGAEAAQENRLCTLQLLRTPAP